MTTYSYTIIFDDGDIITLKAALDFYLQECNSQLVNGPKAPYWAHKRTCEEILKRLYDDTEMTSTNNFTD